MKTSSCAAVLTPSDGTVAKSVRAQAPSAGAKEAGSVVSMRKREAAE